VTSYHYCIELIFFTHSPSPWFLHAQPTVPPWFQQSSNILEVAHILKLLNTQSFPALQCTTTLGCSSFLHSTFSKIPSSLYQHSSLGQHTKVSTSLKKRTVTFS
jgi:hypothetical protein